MTARERERESESESERERARERDRERERERERDQIYTFSRVRGKKKGQIPNPWVRPPNDGGGFKLRLEFFSGPVISLKRFYYLTKKSKPPKKTREYRNPN